MQPCNIRRGDCSPGGPFRRPPSQNSSGEFCGGAAKEGIGAAEVVHGSIVDEGPAQPSMHGTDACAGKIALERVASQRDDHGRVERTFLRLEVGGARGGLDREIGRASCRERV